MTGSYAARTEVSSDRSRAEIVEVTETQWAVAFPNGLQLEHDDRDAAEAALQAYGGDGHVVSRDVYKDYGPWRPVGEDTAP